MNPSLSDKRHIHWHFKLSGDVDDAQIFITSVLYFKGAWTFPFNRTATKRHAFYDEKQNKIGEVDMMFQATSFPYTRIETLRCHALELPYGPTVSSKFTPCMYHKTHFILAGRKDVYGRFVTFRWWNSCKFNEIINETSICKSSLRSFSWSQSNLWRWRCASLFTQIFCKIRPVFKCCSR